MGLQALEQTLSTEREDALATVRAHAASADAAAVVAQGRAGGPTKIDENFKAAAAKMKVELAAQLVVCTHTVSLIPALVIHT